MQPFHGAVAAIQDSVCTPIGGDSQHKLSTEHAASGRSIQSELLVSVACAHQHPNSKGEGGGCNTANQCIVLPATEAILPGH